MVKKNISTTPDKVNVPKKSVAKKTVVKKESKDLIAKPRAYDKLERETFHGKREVK